MVIMKRINSNAETRRRFQDAMHVAAGLLNWVLPDSEPILGATSHEGEEIHVELLRTRDPLAVLGRDQLSVP